MNYKIAWAVLKERFHNKRAIINYCLAEFINYPPMKKANAETSNMIDSIKESLQCFETLIESVDEWNPITVFIMENKLDTETRRAWEQNLGGSMNTPKIER